MTNSPDGDYASRYTKPSSDINRAALVLIDLQVGNCSRLSTQGRLAESQGALALFEKRYKRIEDVVVPTLRRLLSWWRDRDRPVVFVALGGSSPDCSDVLPTLRQPCLERQMFVGSDDYEFLPGIGPESGEAVLRKTTMSAFTSTGLDSFLRNESLNSVFIAGVSTDQCVLSSALDSADRGWATTLVEDCCGASQPEFHQAALVEFTRFAGSALTSEQMMEES